MLYKKLKNLSAANFKRYCGVERKTFERMCEIVRRKSAAQRLKFADGIRSCLGLV